ncbi:MAG: MMPL family transporter [Solirubrobacterales bacterium]
MILAGWTAIVAILLPSALDFEKAQNNRDANYLPKSAESLAAISLEEHAFGDELLTGLLVYNNPNGLRPGDKAAILRDVKQIHARPLVGQYGKTIPLFFKDGKTAAIYVQVRAHGEQQILFTDSDRMRSLAADDPKGLTAKLTGQMGYFDDSVSVLSSIDGNLLAGTIAIVTLLLLLIYRSPFLWMLPLASVGLAEITSRGLGTELAKGGTTVTTQAASLMTVLIFGVGTDYALLLIARYREELRRYEDRHEAMEHALMRSGPPIFASAATVATALLCLTLADVNATSGAGPIGAMGIAIAMLAMLTALPALLLVVGRPAFWPFVPHFGDQLQVSGANFWTRLADRIAARPKPIVLGVFAAMAVMACGLLTHPGGLDLAQSFRGDVESVQGQRLLEKTLPPGATGPVTVLVSDPRQVQRAIAALKRSDDVAAVGLIQQGKGAVRVEATLKYAPYSDEAIVAIDRVRRSVLDAAPGVAYISGATAVEADSRHYAAQDNRLIMPMALLVVLLILILLLRSLVAPFVLMATVIASFIAVMGVSYVAFDLIFGFPGVDEFIPLFVFIFLVALGVDYNIFLMARVREEVILHGPREGMRRGLIVTGGVITSAGIVLAGTFFVLAAMPITMLTEIGFAIGIGVLFDALVVRTALVPALGFMFGRTFWWPSPLSHAQPLAHRPAPDAGEDFTWVGPQIGAEPTNNNQPAGAEDQPDLPDWTRVS